MQISQSTWSDPSGWQGAALNGVAQPDLVLVFGGRSALADPVRIAEIRAAYPQTNLIGCSTAGEIEGVRVHDDTLVATAIRFERTQVQVASLSLEEVGGDSREAGRQLAARLPQGGLRHVFVLSDGLQVNGSELVEGMVQSLPAGTTLTGGLSGDGALFEQTLVLVGEQAAGARIASLGLYGDHIRVGSASLGGWDPFGPERVVTRSEGNVLYELDGTSALTLYKKYLGEHASGLPATGLLFPMTVRSGDDDEPVMRTILGVDEATGSMTFAGDVPQGSLARLMKANFERLVDGAGDAARSSYSPLGDTPAELAILISCVGRKMVLKQRVEEEVEAVREALGAQAVLTGFYSYGEISPFTPDARCRLHNQTMTVTTLSEQ
ncbi:MAG: FIST N-terminal domain-containing protein [Planctomycetota bacterium]